MKKFLCVLFTSVALLASVCAKGKYSGDVQIDLGVSPSIFKMSVKVDDYNANAKIDLVLFDVSFESWNLFTINDWFSVGGQALFGFGVGKVNEMAVSILGYTVASEMDDNTTSWGRFAFGPAVGFSITDIVRINAALGLDIAFDGKIKTKEGASGMKPSAGFYMDFQGKFLPKNNFSPVVGYRFETFAPKKGYDEFEGIKYYGNISNGQLFVNTIYAGCAYSF